MSDLVDRLYPMSPDTIGPAAADEIERLRDESAKWKGLADANARVAEACQRRSEKLRDDLEASQAREAQLREALATCRVEFDGTRFKKSVFNDHAVRKALALPHDDTALKARLKAERERVAFEFGQSGQLVISDRIYVVNFIRNLGDE